MDSQNATDKAIDAIFKARSLAVVGASARPNNLGHIALQTIIDGGYQGKLWPVNPRAEQVINLPAYSTLEDIPEEIDAVVVVVPAPHVPKILLDAVRKGAKGAIILSAGFREAGRVDLEEEIKAIAHRTGLRVMGPNIQGVAFLPNRLCAMFFPTFTIPGPLAVVTQSGTVTAALAEWAERDGLGVCAVVNLGNQADLCETDYLHYFAQQNRAKAVVMYLESVKNGRAFLEAIESVEAHLPVALLKAGRTQVGVRSAASHTGAMAGSHRVFTAACRQYGVVTAEDLEVLYDKAKALATLTPPPGDRVFIMSSSGGAATLTAEEAHVRGLSLPNPSAALLAELQELNLPPLAHLSNPCDLASLSAHDFYRVALAIDKHNAADIILICIGDPIAGTADMVVKLASQIQKSLVVSWLGGGEIEIAGRKIIQQAGIPTFPSPERAVRGIAACVWKMRFRQARPKNGDTHDKYSV